MSEKEMGKALLGLEKDAFGAKAEANVLAQKVIRHDKARIRWLAGISTFFWILTVVGVVWLVIFYFAYVVPRLDAYAVGRLRLDNDWDEWIRAFNAGAQIILTCMIAFLLAAIGTVVLVLTSRHATLRQIQAELAEISEQLRKLRLPAQ